MQGGLKTVAKLFGIGWGLQAIGSTIKEFTSLDEKLHAVKDSFFLGALASSKFLSGLQDTSVSVEWLSFWEGAGETVGKTIDLLAEGVAKLADYVPGFKLAKVAYTELQEYVDDRPLSLTIKVDRDAMISAFEEVNREWQKASEGIKIDPLPDPAKVREGEQRVKEALERGAKLLAEDERKRIISEARQSAIDPLAEGKRVEAAEAYYAALDKSVTAWAQMNAAATELTDVKMPELAEVSIDISKELQAVAGVLAHAFVGIFSGATHNARDFFNSILEGMAEIAAQAATMEIFEAILGGIKGLSDPVKEFHPTVRRMGAKGLAFDRAGMIPFQAGGVVTGPTPFGFSGGVGLMGEAGAEAIMPLKRGRGGALGVASTLPQIQLVNNTGVAAKARSVGSAERMQIILEAADMGRSMALDEVNRSLRTGYGSTATSIQRTYGLRRK